MGPTRKRDLVIAVAAAAVVGYLLVLMLYRYFPPLTVWTGLSLAAVAVALAGWGSQIKKKISEGQIGVGGDRVHPIAVARSVVIAKASAWLGAVVLGWWIAVLAYLIPRRATLRVAGEDTTGAVVAALCALALVAAALWLEHCCKSPQDLSDSQEGVKD
jgi:hypothetical protein